METLLLELGVSARILPAIPPSTSGVQNPVPCHTHFLAVLLSMVVTRDATEHGLARCHCPTAVELRVQRSDARGRLLFR